MSLAVLVEIDHRTERQRERHERDMEAARYRFYNRLSSEEIGKIIECSPRMVRRRLRRAEASGDPRILEWQSQWPDPGD